MFSENNQTSDDVEKCKGDIPKALNNTVSLLVLPKNLASSTKAKVVRLKFEPVSASTLAASACTPRAKSGYWTSCSESDSSKWGHITSDLENCDISSCVAATSCTTGTSTDDGNYCGSLKCKCCSCTPWVDIEVPLKNDVSIPDSLAEQVKKCRKKKKCKQSEEVELCTRTSKKGKFQLIFQVIYYGFVIPFLIVLAVWVSNKSNEQRYFRFFK